MKNKYSFLNVLVTGGAGFIGSHIVEQLVALGARVTVLDNLSSGNLNNLSAVYNQINFMHGTIVDLDSCINATKNVDVILHLAAFISVPDSIVHPTDCYETNVLGTLNILRAAQYNQVKRVIFSSSSAVYGSVEETCTENTPCQPESPYGHSKLIGELLCREFSRSTHLSTVILRYFNVYGERQNPNGPYAAVVAQFKECMKKNIPLTIFGDGTQTRDFVPINTVVQANLTAGTLPVGAHSFEIFNIGTGKSITLLELIEHLKQEFPEFNAGISFLPARSGDIKKSHADCSKFITIAQQNSFK